VALAFGREGADVALCFLKETDVERCSDATTAVTGRTPML
jgi:hypothetical protein